MALDPLEGLELVTTSDPLPLQSDEAQTEAPKRRRGRPPKAAGSAEDDKPFTGDSDSRPKQRRTYARRASDPCKQVEQLEEQIEAMLTGMYSLVGGGVSLVMPVTGMTLLTRSQEGAAAVVTAAKGNAALASWLLKMQKGSTWAPLVMFGAAIGVAAMIDVGALNPLSAPAQLMLGKDVLPMFQQVPQPQQSPNGQMQGQYAPSADAAQYPVE